MKRHYWPFIAILLVGCGSGSGGGSDDKYLGIWFRSCSQVENSTLVGMVVSDLSADDAWLEETVRISRNSISVNWLVYSDSECATLNPITGILGIDDQVAEIITKEVLQTQEGFSFNKYTIDLLLIGSSVPFSFYLSGDRLYDVEEYFPSGELGVGEAEYRVDFNHYYEKNENK